MYKEYTQGRRIRRDGADGDNEYWDKTKALLRAVESESITQRAFAVVWCHQK